MKTTKKAWALSLSLLLSLVPGASLLAQKGQGKGCCVSSACCCSKNCPMRSSHSPMPECCPMSKAPHSGSMTTCTCSISPHPPAPGLTTPVHLIFDLPASDEPPKLDSSHYRQVAKSLAREDAFIPPPDQPPRLCGLTPSRNFCELRTPAADFPSLAVEGVGLQHPPFLSPDPQNGNKAVTPPGPAVPQVLYELVCFRGG